MTATSPVLKQIAGLPKLSQDELKALWREYFGVEPPAYRRGFLVRGLAHRLQELTYGGLKPAYQARLDAMIEGTEKPNGAGRSGRRPRHDVHLLATGPAKNVITISGRYPEPGSVFKDCQACPEMAVVPGGTFIMGAPEGEEGRYGAERPQHEVTIQPFAIGRYEVTFVEWDACVAAGKLGCSTEPEARWGRGRQPVINVSWYAAQEYVAWLKEETGEYYRLPSEAKCEYAARAGTTTRYWWGDEITPENANYGDIGKATDVGAYGANVFGLHDTAGNVWEWAEDCWNGSYERAPQNGAAWLEGDCWQRVVRGGSWSNEPGHLRSAMRGGSRPEGGAYDMGFRVARTLTPSTIRS